MHLTGHLPPQWRNWAGNQECRPVRIVTPTSLEALREAVGVFLNDHLAALLT